MLSNVAGETPMEAQHCIVGPTGCAVMTLLNNMTRDTITKL